MKIVVKVSNIKIFLNTWKTLIIISKTVAIDFRKRRKRNEEQP